MVIKGLGLEQEIRNKFEKLFISEVRKIYKKNSLCVCDGAIRWFLSSPRPSV